MTHRRRSLTLLERRLRANFCPSKVEARRCWHTHIRLGPRRRVKQWRLRGEIIPDDLHASMNAFFREGVAFESQWSSALFEEKFAHFFHLTSPSQNTRLNILISSSKFFVVQSVHKVSLQFQKFITKANEKTDE